MLPINYGWCSHNNYITAGETIVQDFDQCNMSGVIEKINNTFFGGGVFAPKSFSDLASVIIPQSTHHVTVRVNPGGAHFARAQIRKKVSSGAILGYAEAIPFIGTVLAIINALGSLMYILIYYRVLKRAVVELKAIERNDFNMGRGASSHYTSKVFDAAVDYTVNRNLLIGSLLSIIPFVKPIVRLAQGILYQCQPPVHQPVL